MTWTAQAVGKASMSGPQPATTTGTAMKTTLDGTDVSLKVSQPITTESNKQYIFKANYMANDAAVNCTLYGQPGNLNVAFYVYRPGLVNTWQVSTVLFDISLAADTRIKSMSLPFYGNAAGQKMGMSVSCPDVQNATVAWDNVYMVPNNGPVRGAG